MKKIFFAAFALSILFATVGCKSDNQIFVRFQNSTDAAIEASTMNFDGNILTDIGPIAVGETTDYIAFDYFEVGYYEGGDYIFPTGQLEGKNSDSTFEAWSWNWCGTGVSYKQLEPGKYTIQISIGKDGLLNNYKIKFLD